MKSVQREPDATGRLNPRRFSARYTTLPLVPGTGHRFTGAPAPGARAAPSWSRRV
jgi:hypothetical protein